MAKLISTAVAAIRLLTMYDMVGWFVLFTRNIAIRTNQYCGGSGILFIGSSYRMRHFFLGRPFGIHHNTNI